jgi:hypothetical protein
MLAAHQVGVDRSVNFGSLWPSCAITEAGSSPQATSTEAKVWRSLWGVSPCGSGECLRFASSSLAHRATGSTTRVRTLSLSRFWPLALGKTGRDRGLGLDPVGSRTPVAGPC